MNKYFVKIPYSYSRYGTLSCFVYAEDTDDAIDLAYDYNNRHSEDFDDILYIEGMYEYLIIKTRTSKITTLQSFKNIEKLLPKSNIIRVHKSFMIAIDKIGMIEKHIIKIGDKEIPIGDKFKKRFFEVIFK